MGSRAIKATGPAKVPVRFSGRLRGVRLAPCGGGTDLHLDEVHAHLISPDGGGHVVSIDTLQPGTLGSPVPP